MSRKHVTPLVIELYVSNSYCFVVTIRVVADTEYRSQNEGTSLKAVVSDQLSVVFTNH